MLLENGVCYEQCVLLTKLLAFAMPASFCTPRSNLPVTPGISGLPTFAFQSTMMKRTSFLVLVLEGLVGLYVSIEFKLLWH